MKNLLFLTLISLLTGCFQSNEDYLGTWYSPNYLVSLTLFENGEGKTSLIEKSDDEDIEWRQINDKLIFIEQDTFRLVNDTLFSSYSYFTKEKPKENVDIGLDSFLGKKFSWVSDNDENVMSEVVFLSNDTFEEKDGFGDKNTISNKKWSLIKFLGNAYIKVETFTGMNRYLRIVDYTPDNIKLSYFDSHEEKYVFSSLHMKY